MNSSGIKRGLAVAAISALAVTGVPALVSPASAESVTQDVTAATGANSTEIFTQFAPNASTRPDGVNNTIHLLAGGGTNVASVRFQYTVAGGAPVTIATVAKANGVFSTEWAPSGAVLGEQVVITAVGINNVGNDIAGGVNDTATTTVNANADSVDIANAPGATTGFFQQPYGVEEPEIAGTPFFGVSHDTAPAIVNGTTSATGGVIELSDRSEGSRVFAGTAIPAPSATADANGIRTFRGAVNFADYVFDGTAGATNEAVVGAAPGTVTTPASGNTPAVVNRTGSDDAEVLNLRRQTITNVTAVATDSTVNNGGTGEVTVTVTDQFGALLSGAQVIFDADNDNVWDAGTPGTDANNDGDFTDAGDTAPVGNELEGYTNANGQVVFPITAAQLANNTDNTFAFFVNTDDDNDYQAAKDFRRTATITTGPAAPATTLVASSADGLAFDYDEDDADDIRARLTDAAGNGVAGQNVSYSYTFTAFPTAATPNPTPVTTPVATAGPTGADGFVSIPFLQQATGGTYVLNTYIDRDGTPGQSAGDLSGTALTFKAGDSTLEFEDAPAAAQLAGSTETYDATLELEDGTALAGRLVNFTYTPAGAGNAQLAAQGSQPEGTTRTATGASDTTDADGTVSVAVVDPPAATPAAESGTLNAATGNNVATATNTLDGNPAENASLAINVGIGEPPAVGTEVEIVGLDGAEDARPGDIQGGSVTVNDVDSDGATGPDTATGPIAGATVTLSVDKGFFTDGELEDETPADGDDTNEFNSLGQTITVVTGTNGQVDFQYVAERLEGLDDDGLDIATITATSGDSDTEQVDFDTTGIGGAQEPLNGGSVELRLSPDEEQGGPTNPADVDQRIVFDVYTTDQFGNLWGDQEVELDSDNNDVRFGGGTGYYGTVDSNFDDQGDFFVFSNDETPEDATITATWNAPFSEFDVTNGVTTTVTGNRDLTDTADVSFEAAVPTTATIVSSPEGEVQVGTVVTETLTAVDQNGQPVAGARVEILRSGPGSESERLTRTTDVNGQAVFQITSTTAGDATISAVVTDGTATLQATDTITFVGVEGMQPASITVASSPEGQVRTNTNVLETFTVLDEDGDPVADEVVTITRTGPGATTETVTRTTNANGIATYTVTSAEAGTATISATVADGTLTAEDAITFVNRPARIRATLTAPNNGGRNDVITVRATAIGDYPRNQAAGSFVKLVKATGRGDNLRQRTVASGRLNANAAIRFVRADNNGKRTTRYFAVINPQRGVNFGDRSNTRAVR